MRQSWVGGVLALCCASGVAAAWNPLQWFGDAVNHVGGAVGGFLATVTAPTLNNVEASGAGVVDALDASLAGQLEDANAVGGALIRTAGDLAGAGLDRADKVMAARILQLKVSGQQVTADLMGRVDAVSKARLAEAVDGGKLLLAQLDKTAQDALTRADQLLAARTEAVAALLRNTVVELDHALERRITQADEVTERRLGNLDVLSTKASLQAERIALRLFTLLGLFVFLAFALWRVYVEVVNASDEAYALIEKQQMQEAQKNRHVVKTAAVRVAVQVAGGVVCAGVLLLVGNRLPMGATADATTLENTHRAALLSAVSAMDLTRARYHASQLLILRPDEAAQHAEAVARVEVLRDLFTRPTLLHTVDGVRQAVARLQQLDQAHPDVLTARAFVSWSVAATRHGEKEAAQLCAQALAQHVPFTLQPLAQHYVRAYLHHPFEADDVLLKDLRAVVTTTPLVFAPLQHVLDMGQALVTLDTAVSPAWLDLLDAHARLLEAGTGKELVAEAARTERQAAARTILDAFERFERDVIHNGTLRGTTAPLAAFWVNDAVVAHAAWFQAHPDTAQLPPLLRDIPSQAERIRSAPPRVYWARALLPGLGTRVGGMVGLEETARFLDLEARSRTFAGDYVALRRAELSRRDGARINVLRAQAARSAAEGGVRYPVGAGALQLLSDVLARDAGDAATADLQRVVGDARGRRVFRVL